MNVREIEIEIGRLLQELEEQGDCVTGEAASEIFRTINVDAVQLHGKIW